MNLLLITRNFPPMVGGMERLNLHLAEALSQIGKTRVIAPARSTGKALGEIEVLEVPHRPLWRFLFVALWKGLQAARITRPDAVMAGSGLTAPLSWLAARASKGEAIVYLHGLDIVVPHPVYRALWHPFLRRMDKVIANSHATAKLAEEAGISPERITIIHPGVTLPPSVHDQDLEPLRSAFRSQHGLGNAPLLLSVGRLTERKGLLEFVRDVMPIIVAQIPDVLLVIIGNAPDNALYAKAQTQEQILTVAEKGKVSDHLRFLGEITDWHKLREAYYAADVHVFPIRNIPNDPEGFGMVAIEAAAHGLPTVAYATGGVVDAIAEGQSGHLVPPGNDTAFAQAVCSLLQKPLPAASMKAFASRFAWPEFARKVKNTMDARQNV